MIEIDGSVGEGGGQILRTSLTLSVLTGEPMRIHHIRSRRKPPGLKPQHLMSAQTAARISNGRLVGAELGATEIRLYPGEVQSGDYTFDVSSVKASAGSTSLIFQTLFAPLGFAEGSSHVTIKGGTDVILSPVSEYIREVFLPTIAPMGIKAKMNIPSRGYYPIGGGILDATLSQFQTPLTPLRIEERGRLKNLKIVSMISNLPFSIAERQMNQLNARLSEKGFQAEGETRTAPSPGKGTLCFILAEFENIRAGFSALGEIGKRAEKVADEAVDAFLRYWDQRGALDPHLADQVILYMALAERESIVTTVELTEHLRTNIRIIEQFLPVRFNLKKDPGGMGGSILVSGASLRRRKK